MAGFVSQFIVPAEEFIETAGHRIEHAVRDLGRSMGFITDAIIPATTVDCEWVMGLWTVSGNGWKRGEMFPLVTRFGMESGKCEVMFPGLTRWISYRNAALQLARGDVHPLGAKDALRWWGTILNEIMENTLLIVEAHKSRMWWPWLTNSNLTRLHVELGPGEQLHPSVREKLRVVRCRFGEETPQWYVAGERKQGHTSGVYQVGTGIWYSLQRRASNLTLRNDFRRLDSPSIQAWTPRIVELVPLGFQDEQSEQAAVLFTHQLRNMLPHFDSPAVLPLPIHFGKKLAENILCIRDEDGEV